MFQPSVAIPLYPKIMRTQLNNNGEAFIALHAYLGECRIGGTPLLFYHLQKSTYN